jgi:hypothetical protein
VNKKTVFPLKRAQILEILTVIMVFLTVTLTFPPMCQLPIEEDYFAGAALSIDSSLPQIPRRDNHKSLEI